LTVKVKVDKIIEVIGNNEKKEEKILTETKQRQTHTDRNKKQKDKDRNMKHKKERGKEN
jgi:hypothetical protein